MPVEVKELVIRAVVTEEGRKETPNGDAGKAVKSDFIVRVAVEEVLRILKASKER